MFGVDDSFDAINMLQNISKNKIFPRLCIYFFSDLKLNFSDSKNITLVITSN